MKYMTASVLALIVLLQGCSAGPRLNHAVVHTFFATDRDHTPDSGLKRWFGNGRSHITYGTIDVSIPRDHRMGKLESPSLLRLEVREDPDKHVMLLDAALLSRSDFLAEVSDGVMKSSKKDAFIFVHGYNVSFEDAARRTAQMSYDLGFDGVPVFYSWPSQGTMPAYLRDEQNIEWAETNLRTFLDNFFHESKAERVYLIAHSMGTRALTRAVARLLEEQPALRKQLTELILTAPDVDADVFKREIAPRLAATGRPVTLYASSGDRALIASKQVHGYPRAGDSGIGLVVTLGIETIDATGMDTSLLGHSYFADTRSVLGDMFYLIRDGKRASERFGLRPMESKAGEYWAFKE